MPGRTPRRPPLPTREQLVEFIRESDTPVGRREIARAFSVAPKDRAALREMIRDLEAEGAVARGRKRRVAPPGTLPPVTVIELTGLDADGEPLARPVKWPGETAPPRIRITRGPRGRAAPGIGDHVLARLRRTAEGEYEAAIIHVIEHGPSRVLGVYRRGPEGGRVSPTDRRIREDYAIGDADSGGAAAGELVEVEILPHRHLGLRHARVTERLGDMHAPGAASMIAIHANGIPHEFPQAALDEARRPPPLDEAHREDIRHLPLVTIDGADARDFDDAVFAEPLGDAAGWRAVVAIADVAWYVRPGSALDRAAYERGNSVYFPDRVVPMLPEALSNDLCSLRPDEDRGCLAVEMRIGADGALTDHRFFRATMRSAARLTYDQVEAAHRGEGEGRAAELAETAIAPLYAVYSALRAAREKRGAIDLDLPERQVVMAEGRIVDVKPRQRWDSHRLIEECMIAANVAAAETLERHRLPCMYRVHEEPAEEKVEALRDYVEELGFRLPRGQVLKPRHFNDLVQRAARTDFARMINEAVLRSQSQAAYAPENLGHFGLALRRYAHFTSPIRRYSDLVVHRALVRALKAGAGGLSDEETARFDETGLHISRTERRAMTAEREALDRLTAGFLAEHVGAEFAARVTGVARYGLFVELDETGASGLLPAARMGPEFYRFEPRRKVLVGSDSGEAFGLGMPLRVRLEEADLVTGMLSFTLAAASPARPQPRGRRRSRGGR